MPSGWRIALSQMTGTHIPVREGKLIDAWLCQGCHFEPTPCATPDHFIPLLYLAGLAGTGDGHPEVLVDGHGS